MFIYLLPNPINVVSLMTLSIFVYFSDRQKKAQVVHQKVRITMRVKSMLDLPESFLQQLREKKMTTRVTTLAVRAKALDKGMETMKPFAHRNLYVYPNLHLKNT